MHNQLRDEVHQANIDDGWWTDLDTGESIVTTKNRPQVLCLIVSEICEAYEGGYLPDSHLPQYPAFEVELADAAIRILDLAGADKIDLDNPSPTPAKLLNPMELVCLIAGEALEGYRRRDTEKYHRAISKAYHSILTILDDPNMRVIHDKREYNKNRADHKIENRLKPGGKRI